MSSTSETGHAKNVALFDDIISFVTGYGTDYKPSKDSIKLTALKALSANAKTAISDVHAAFSANSNASAAREVAFEPLDKLTTRVLNALKATDTSTQVDESARTIVRKIHGERAKAKKNTKMKTNPPADGTTVKEPVYDAVKVPVEETPKEISVSQLSFDSRLDNLDKLIKLLESIPVYKPNEADLNVTGLTALITDLIAKNSEVIATTTLLSNARISRDAILYKADSGMVDVALAVKNYVKSLYGSTSPQYKQVSVLEFRDR